MKKCDVCGGKVTDDCVNDHGVCAACRKFGRWHNEAEGVWDDELPVSELVKAPVAKSSGLWSD